MFSLMYHRIDDPDTNPWGVCVSAARFEEQIKWITTHYTVIDSATLLAQLTDREPADGTVLLTFDDGYQDNFVTAKPILEKYHCPATFFIPTSFIGSDKSFWWDELEAILLHSPVLPSELRLTISGEQHVFNLSGSVLTGNEIKQIQAWRWYEEPAPDRCEVFLAIWTLLRPLSQTEIETQLRSISRWGDPAGRYNKVRLPMTGSQLRELAGNPLFTIGMHSDSHPDLSAQNEEVQWRELATGRDRLKNIYGIDSSMLAYPYGMFNGVTLSLIQRLQPGLCFTTEAAEITSTSDRFQLGRFQPEEGDISTFISMLPG